MWDLKIYTTTLEGSEWVEWTRSFWDLQSEQGFLACLEAVLVMPPMRWHFQVVCDKYRISRESLVN